MKNKFFIVLLSTMLLAIGVIHADIKDGEYPVKVCLLKAYEEDYSMGNNAMLSEATLFVRDGKGRLRVNFVPLETRGFRGYLGALWVNGVPASVISTYDEVDNYNDAENGIDERMKGQKYPHILEFDVDLSSEIMPCRVYVPVMAEMGVGEQNARIKISYPDGFGEEEIADAKDDGKEVQNDSKTDDNSISDEQNETLDDLQDEDDEDVQNEIKDIEDEDAQDDGDEKGEKYYTVPIKLWHAVEDRRSMGNGAMTNQANIYVKDGRMTLYIGSNTMKVSSITASLINLYYDNGTEFVKATPYSFNLKIDGFEELRPEVFSMPLKNKDEYLFVMVDPKVEPMGDDPIKARFKLDFARMKEIAKEEAKLIKMAENGKKRLRYDASKESTKSDKGISIVVPKNTFDNDYTFYANQIRGEEINNYKKNFDSLSIIKGYKLSCLGDLNKISYDAKRPINKLRESYQPKNSIKINIPIEKNAVEIKLYAMDKDNKVELDFKQNSDKISFEYDKFVPFIIIYKKDLGQNNITKTTNNKANAIQNNSNNEYKNSVKNLMLNGLSERAHESIFFIVFYITLIVILASISIYIICKNYKKIKNEIYYAEYLKLKIKEKQNILESKIYNEEEKA